MVIIDTVKNHLIQCFMTIIIVVVVFGNDMGIICKCYSRKA